MRLRHWILPARVFLDLVFLSSEQVGAGGSKGASVIANNTAECLTARPVPVVLFAKGRSGSTSTWQALSSLMGGGTPAIEFSGSNPQGQRKFFATHTTGEWLTKLICRQQQGRRTGIVGTKWKPPFSWMVRKIPGAWGALEFLRDHHQIKVVRLVRNPLDVLVSGYKHGNSRVPAQCARGDAGCLKRHLKASTGIVLPTKGLLADLRGNTNENEAFDRLLDSVGIPHIDVTYDELYSSESASAWRQILKFLGQPSPGLTIANVRKALKTVPTSNRSLNVTLSNYEEVRTTLSGSAFERLMH